MVVRNFKESREAVGCFEQCELGIGVRAATHHKCGFSNPIGLELYIYK